MNPKAPKLIVTHHEQNASFIAGGIGRLTGKPGVVLTTSGPGVSNLATGLVTATAEGDPVLAISGQVPRRDLKRLTHQSMDNAALLAPVTKYSAEVQDPNNLSEVLSNAYQEAVAPKQGRPLFRYRKTSPTGSHFRPVSSARRRQVGASQLE